MYTYTWDSHIGVHTFYGKQFSEMTEFIYKKKKKTKKFWFSISWDRKIILLQNAYAKIYIKIILPYKL